MDEIKELEAAYKKLQDLRIKLNKRTEPAAQTGSLTVSTQDIEEEFHLVLESLRQIFGVDFSKFPIHSNERLCGHSVLEERIWKTQEAIKHWYVKMLAKEADPGIGYEVSDADISKDFETETWAVRLRKGRVYEAVKIHIPDEWVSDRETDRILRVIKEGATRMLVKINRLGHSTYY